MTPRNIIHLLEAHDPSALAALRKDFPEAGDLLRRDRHLGEAATAISPELVKTELAETTVRVLRERIDKILGNVAKRLRRAEGLKTMGSVVTAVSSAGLVTSFTKISAGFEFISEPFLASTALAASLVSLFSERLTGGKNGDQIRKKFEKLVAMSTALLADELKLRRFIAGVSVPRLLDEILVSLDDTALEVHAIELQLGVE